MEVLGSFFREKLKRRACCPNISDTRGDTRCRSKGLNALGLTKPASPSGEVQAGELQEKIMALQRDCLEQDAQAGSAPKDATSKQMESC